MIRVGIVGTGFVGAVHIEAIRRLGFATIVGLADVVDCESKAKTFNISNYYDSYKEMLDNLELDVLHICTPNSTHKEIALYAAKKGVNVICEKPLATSYSEAQDMLEAFRGNTLIHSINYHNRFNPMIMQIKDMISDGEMGEVLSIHGNYIQDWLLEQTSCNWRISNAKDGETRVVSDIGTHLIDAIEFVTSMKITKVIANFSTVYKERLMNTASSESFVESFDKSISSSYKKISVNTEDIATIMFTMENGAVGCIMLSEMFAGKTNNMSFSIAGSKQSVEWNSDNYDSICVGRKNNASLIYKKNPETATKNVKELISYPGGHMEGFCDAFKHSFKAIYDSISNPTKKSGIATFNDGARGNLISDKLFESNQKQCWIDIK